MDFRVIFFSSYETVLSVIFGLITVFLTCRILDLTILRSKQETETDNALKKGNIALGILGGTITICVLILVQSSILPSVSALETMVLGNAKITPMVVFISLGYFILFYVIATVISILVLFLSIWLYMKATTNIDEVKEIKANNIAVSIILSLVILGVTIFIRPSVNRFISSFVSYEQIKKDNEPDVKLKKGQAAPPKKEVMPEKVAPQVDEK
jgi:uncharacterized membrane protein YjfL (UPF0719 family)